MKTMTKQIITMSLVSGWLIITTGFVAAAYEVPNISTDDLPDTSPDTVESTESAINAESIVNEDIVSEETVNADTVIAEDQAELTPITLRVFSAEELAAFDGKEGRLAYVGYENLIYDVTTSPLFEEGKHFSHLSGQDLTEFMANAPHGGEAFAEFAVVGRLTPHANAVVTINDAVTEMDAETETEAQDLETTLWGKTLLTWSAYALGYALVLYIVLWLAVPTVRRQNRTSGFNKVYSVLFVVLAIIHIILGVLHSFDVIV